MTDDRVHSLWSVPTDGSTRARSECTRRHTTVRHGIASRAIAHFSTTGSTVLDLYGGAGGVVRAAVGHGRNVISLTGHRCCWEAGQAELAVLKRLGFRNDGMVITPARRWPAELLPPVDLMLLGLRSDRHERHAVDELLELLHAFSEMPAIGGYVVVVTPLVRVGGELVDVPARVAQVGRLSGLTPVARLVAQSGTHALESIIALRVMPTTVVRTDVLPLRRSNAGPSADIMMAAA